MRKIRILVSDPEATDSSSDEEPEKRPVRPKRLVHEIFIDKVKAATFKQPCMHNVKNSQLDHMGGGGSIKKYVGVHRRRSGKYTAEIRDPFRRKKVWLGTFNTAEEAYKVYLTKKIEFRKALASREGLEWVVCKESEPVPDFDACNSSGGGSETSNSNEEEIGEEDLAMKNNEGSNTQRVLAISYDHSSQQVSSLGLEIDSSQGCSRTTINARAGNRSSIGKIVKDDGVINNGNCAIKIEKDGIEDNAYSASDTTIEDAVGSNVGSGVEQIFGIVNGQEGICGVKFETYESPSSVLETKHWHWFNGGSETSKFNAEIGQSKEDSVKGMFVQDSNGEEFNVSMKYASPIIDDHGFLLGKWSWIDDLSICGTEEIQSVGQSF